MSNLQPPYSDIGAYAAALGAMVVDTRSPRPDADFVAEAVRSYSDDVPVRATSDVGDGSTKEWELGKAAEPFANWTFGYSESWHLQIEQLAASAPQDPPAWLRGDSFRVEERTVSGAQKLFLVFESAPAASPSQARVHWRRVWTVDGSTNEVRLHHQQAVVYLAAVLKCRALQAVYAATRTEASDLFDGSSKVEEYRRLAGDFLASYKRATKSRRFTGITRGQARTGRSQIFGRGYRT